MVAVPTFERIRRFIARFGEVDPLVQIPDREAEATGAPLETSLVSRGTDGSNPASSSGESVSRGLGALLSAETVTPPPKRRRIRRCSRGASATAPGGCG